MDRHEVVGCIQDLFPMVCITPDGRALLLNKSNDKSPHGQVFRLDWDNSVPDAPCHEQKQETADGLMLELVDEYTEEVVQYTQEEYASEVPDVQYIHNLLAEMLRRRGDEMFTDITNMIDDVKQKVADRISGCLGDLEDEGGSLLKRYE